jgi:hypothetical protein
LFDNVRGCVSLLGKLRVADGVGIAELFDLESFTNDPIAVRPAQLKTKTPQIIRRVIPLCFFGCCCGKGICGKWAPHE